MAEDKNTARTPSFWEQALAKRAEWAKDQPSLSAELRAMGREAAKDIHNTLNQVFFGTPSGPGEPGTPMNPTPQMVTQDLNVLDDYQATLDGYSAAKQSPSVPHKAIER